MMDHTTKHHMDLEWSPNSKMKVLPMTKKLAFSLACRIFMGMDYSSARVSRMAYYFDIINTGFLSVPINLPGTAFRWGINAAESICKEIGDVVHTVKLQSPLGSDYLSCLLSTSDEKGKLLSEQDIAIRIMGILIASQENTTSLFTNTVYYLADHPHVYSMALKEQIEIKSSKGEEKLLTFEDIKQMNYGRRVVNEVMRMAPPAVGFFREALHNISYEGFTIPKGWKIFSSTNVTHKDPNYFKNPDKFDPSRFDRKGPSPNSFVPFGGGPRMCPGHEYARQAALVFLHNLLINFKWEKIIANEKILQAPFSVPANGLPIKLQQRCDDARTH